MEPEILAPAGNWEMLAAAINAGADAVYFGVQGLNMRAGARNFTTNDIKDIVKKCHDGNCKVYLALNTIIFEDELSAIDEILKAAKGVDAVICWDMAVAAKAVKLGFEVHLSTQASVANTAAMKFYQEMGVSRFILARECTLDEIKNMSKDAEIEVFIHGAMCVAVSGRCFMSEHLYGKSANRGECIQPCRRGYLVKDAEEGKELEIDNQYVMSPKDLCTMPFIDKLIDAGISALKIEGRNRSPEYVKTTVECYKEAIELHKKGKLTEKKKKEFVGKLQTVYNRGFSDGFFMGRPIEDWSKSYGNQSTMVKKFIGVVDNYFPKAGAMEVRLETGKLKTGDTVLVIGPTTGCVETIVSSMEIEGKTTRKVSKGQSVGVKVADKVRTNDKVYIFVQRKN